MNKVIFSSWGGMVVDNRGLPPMTILIWET